jgi:hypothetical protein
LRSLESAPHRADDDEVNFLGQGELGLQVLGEFLALWPETQLSESGIMEMIVV